MCFGLLAAYYRLYVVGRRIYVTDSAAVEEVHVQSCECLNVTQKPKVEEDEKRRLSTLYIVGLTPLKIKQICEFKRRDTEKDVVLTLVG